MFLLEGGAKTVGAGVEAERAGVVGDGVPVRVDHDRRDGMFVKDVPDDDLYFWGENELNALLQPGVNEA